MGACLKGASKGFKEGLRGASVVSSKGGALRGLKGLQGGPQGGLRGAYDVVP